MTPHLQLARRLSFGDDAGISDAEILAAAEEEFAPRGPREKLKKYDLIVLLTAIEIVRKQKRWSPKVMCDELGYASKILHRWAAEGTCYCVAHRAWTVLESLYAK